MDCYRNLATFKRWDKVADYESDDCLVTLLDHDGNELGTYIFPQFTKQDFVHHQEYFERKSI